MRIILLGDATNLATLNAATRIHNGRPEGSDSVLLAVSAREGPMPSFIESLSRITGSEAARVAILITEVNGVDEELIELVELEVRDLLAAVEVLGPGVAGRMACFRSDDAKLGEKVLSWTSSTLDPTRFAKAELLPDW